jgi:hypothetical protein
VLVAAAQNKTQAIQTLQFLWRQDATLQITEPVLLAAVQNLQQGVQILKFLWSKPNKIEITDQLFDLINQNWDCNMDILKKHWKTQSGLLTPRILFWRLRLQKQQRKQIFNFLQDKQRCLQDAIFVG